MSKYGYMLPLRKRRNHGLERPFSSQQILAIILYSSTTFAHYMIISMFFDESLKYIYYAVSGALTISVIISWYVASTTNPEVSDHDTPSALICGRQKRRGTHYCPECRKSIFEIDHHCTFLNNCIGTKNYLAFLVLVTTSGAQEILQILVAVFIATIYYDSDHIHK
jgi:hypothetical protein